MCLSREEQDSIRALAATSEETEQLARTFYEVLMSDPEVRSRSSDRMKAIRPSQIPADIYPEEAKVEG